MEVARELSTELALPKPVVTADFKSAIEAEVGIELTLELMVPRTLDRAEKFPAILLDSLASEACVVPKSPDNVLDSELKPVKTEFSTAVKLLFICDDNEVNLEESEVSWLPKAVNPLFEASWLLTVKDPRPQVPFVPVTVALITTE